MYVPEHAWVLFRERVDIGPIKACPRDTQLSFCHSTMISALHWLLIF